jgi:hypothetical protein
MHRQITWFGKHKTPVCFFIGVVNVMIFFAIPNLRRDSSELRLLSATMAVLSILSFAITFAPDPKGGGVTSFSLAIKIVRWLSLPIFLYALLVFASSF